MSGVGGHYVFLKLSAHDSGDGLTKNVIPLKVTSVSCSVSKTIPSIPIPLSGSIFGESSTTALDIGAASKSLSLTGVILSETITKQYSDGTDKSLKFTAHEIAQMIASSVDSTGTAINQAISELVVLMPSFVKSDYTYRAGVDGVFNTDDASILVPFTFASRGTANNLDNEGVVLPNSFPDSSTAKGVEGFLRSFSFDLAADTIEISFSMDFEVARVFPRGNPFI